MEEKNFHWLKSCASHKKGLPSISMIKIIIILPNNQQKLKKQHNYHVFQLWAGFEDFPGVGVEISNLDADGRSFRWQGPDEEEERPKQRRLRQTWPFCCQLSKHRFHLLKPHSLLQFYETKSKFQGFVFVRVCAERGLSRDRDRRK